MWKVYSLLTQDIQGFATISCAPQCLWSLQSLRPPWSIFRHRFSIRATVCLEAKLCIMGGERMHHPAICRVCSSLSKMAATSHPKRSIDSSFPQQWFAFCPGSFVRPGNKGIVITSPWRKIKLKWSKQLALMVSPDVTSLPASMWNWIGATLLEDFTMHCCHFTH